MAAPLRPALVVALLLVPRLAIAAPLPGAPELEPALRARLEAARRAHSGPARTRHVNGQGRPRFVNRLALEASPYLRQHAHNPVNWFPWGPEAFDTARRLGRPIFLSIGYSTCHWCHVMEEESFEDLEIAELLNRNFVAIKVDREERPDLDAVYMAAVQALTGGGGWPMTLVLTADKQPFFAGTYFPPRDVPERRRIGLSTVLRRVIEVFGERNEVVERATSSLAADLGRALVPPAAVGVLGPAQIRRAIDRYEQAFDAEHGGIGQRQKFPSALPIELLLRAHRRGERAGLLSMVKKTLDAMRQGGIHDHVGGGFHRYTVDRAWTVPHFEKMLYDNAALAQAYLAAWQVTGEAAYAATVRDVLDYVARDMTAPEGTFYAATDADSGGEEGRYFVWTPDELARAVGPDLTPLARRAYGLAGEPNFEGDRFVLRRDRTVAELAEEFSISQDAAHEALVQIRQALQRARAERVAPLRDEKQLVGWNGRMISAFARAGLALRESEYVERASRAARILLDRARQPPTDDRPEDDRPEHLVRYLLQDRAHGAAILDDYAYLIAGLLDLFEATGTADWLSAAQKLQDDQDRRFFDGEAGGYWLSASDGENLLVRPKPVFDTARPSGNAISVQNLLRLHELTGRAEYRIHAEMTLRAFSQRIERAPTEAAAMLEALDLWLDESREILIVTPERREQAEPFLRELGATYLPNRAVVVATEADVAQLTQSLPLLANKRAIAGRVTAYVCTNRVCQLPASEVESFRKQIQQTARPYPGTETATEGAPGETPEEASESRS